MTYATSNKYYWIHRALKNPIHFKTKMNTTGLFKTLYNKAFLFEEIA